MDAVSNEKTSYRNVLYIVGIILTSLAAVAFFLYYRTTPIRYACLSIPNKTMCGVFSECIWDACFGTNDYQCMPKNEILCDGIDTGFTD